MGFTAAIAAVTAAVTAASAAFTGYSQHQESKALKKVAKMQTHLTNEQSEAAIDTATQNQIAAQRNANAQMASARADAAASNLADEGSVRVREMDLATRLEDEIAKNTNAALQQADASRKQGLLNAWDTSNSAKMSKLKSYGSMVGGFGSILAKNNSTSR